MAERDQRARVVQALRRLDAIPVENGGCCPGTPDVEFIGGWMECKWLRAWPARDDTVVRLDHPVTPGQRIWHNRRSAAGGACWMLLQVRHEWLLFRGDVGARILGTVTRAELYEYACRIWSAGLRDEELLACVSPTKNVSS